MAIQIIFALIVVVLVFRLPESPRWLLRHNLPTEAMEVLYVVYDKELGDPYIINERESIDSAIEAEMSELKSGSFFSVFKQDSQKTRTRVILAWVIQFMNQAGGINLIVYYAPCK